MDVTIDKFGRIVIPKTVRDWLGLEAGTELHLEVTEQGSSERAIVLRPPSGESVLTEVDGLLVYTGSVQSEDVDVVDSLRKSRDDRSRRLTGI